MGRPLTLRVLEAHAIHTRSTGMLVSRDQYDGIRSARYDDLSHILGLIKPLEDKGVLVTRSTQMQLQGYRTPMECHRAIVRANGVKGLYNGFWPFLAQCSAKAAIRFFSFEAINRAIDSAGVDRTANTTAWALFSGLGAGCIESMVLTAPTDRVKVLGQAMSAQRGGVPPTALELVKSQGVGSLYVGSVATTMRQGSSVAVRFACYAKVKEMVCSLTGFDASATPGSAGAAPAWVNFLSGGCGGALSVCLNNPIDVVKSKVQAGYRGGMVKCLQEVVQERGLLGLTAGLSARVPRLFLSQAIQFSLVDYFKAALAPF